MSFDKDGVKNTFTVAIGLSLICSIVVSGLAVLLKPRQEANAERFRRQNILEAAKHLIGVDGEIEDAEVNGLYQKHVTAKFVELDKGRPTDEFPLPGEEFTTEDYDLQKAARNEELIEGVKGANIAGLQGAKREKVSVVYEIRVGDELKGYVLPVRGYGLWSTLWGFIALEADTRTIRGLTFYEHKETPGLGGEVDNPGWKAQWNGKQVYDVAEDETVDADDEIAIEVVKGTASGDLQVDGLAGATITSRGVTNMLRYWLGPDGFGPFLERVRGPKETSASRGSRIENRESIVGTASNNCRSSILDPRSSLPATTHLRPNLPPRENTHG